MLPTINGVLLHLSLEEANALLALLNRVQITGAEAMPTVVLMQRIQQGLADYQERAKEPVEG